tara:strand:- start:1102 stop:1245 length:144 start_codon:yes stop_codon:yes gene_type:complete
MILNYGQSLEWTQSNTYQPMNLTWSASYTQNITSIVFINPAPAHPKQ